MTGRREDDALYPVTVLPRRSHTNPGRVMIHYTGYGSEYDEWRESEDLVQLGSPCVMSEKYDLHQDLALKIKSLLVSSRRSSPVSRIDIQSDV